MATWYKVVKHSVRIEAVEVAQHTDASVYIRGRQLRRHTSHDCYFPTWEEARQRLVERARTKLQAAEATVRTAQNDLQTAMALAPPRLIEFGFSVTGTGP